MRTGGLAWIMACFMLTSIAGTSHAIEKTATGFYYPTGTSDFGGNPGWLAADNDYFSGLCHLGADMKAAVGAPIYAISDGIITLISDDEAGWGTGNLGIVVKHKLANDQEFLALYAHVRSTLQIGDQVTGGVQFATVGPYTSGNHLHFGIHPNLTMPQTNWGREPSPCTAPYNGFVDPVQWIQNHVPAGLYSCQWQSQIPSGIANVFPGQTLSLSVSYTNTGTTSWHSSGGQANPDFIELRSCDVSGNLANSWLYPGANQGWTDAQRVVSANADGIENGQIATFVFKGRVPGNAAPGLYKIYFRPHHTTGGLIENWGGMHFQINVVTGWLASTPRNDCVGPVDAQGHRWSEPEFYAGAWSPITIPDGNWGCSNCDRYYRRYFDYPGVATGMGAAVWFRSDDGCELYVNGIRVGGWGSGYCHQSGCVNGTNCAINQTLPAVDISSYLHQGLNIIGMHVSNGGQGAYFDFALTTPPLSEIAPGVCCLGNTCTPIGPSFTASDCSAGGGTVYQGKEYDCGVHSPCDPAEEKAKGDPVMTFSTDTPNPPLPASLTFRLVDTLPHTAWFELPFGLGGDTIYVDSSVGQFSVYAQNSSHADTVNLRLLAYSFQAPSVMINGLHTGPNTVSLDTTVVPVRHGTYCKSTRQVDMVIPAFVSNSLFPPANAIRSQSHVLGSFDPTTGVLVAASTSIDILPSCCVGLTGNVDCDPGDNIDIADLSALIDYLYISFLPLCCEAEANTDGASGIDISDLSALIDYLYISFTPTAPCQ